MAIITKTGSIALLPLQSIAANSTVLSTPQDVSTRFGAFIGIHFGRRSVTALTTGVEVRVEGSPDATASDNWWPLHTFRSNVTLVESELVTGTVSAGQPVITVASTTGLALEGLIYIDNTTIANSQFGRIAAVATNVSVTLEDNLLTAQTGSTIYSLAEYSASQIDLSAIIRVRVVVNASNSGQATAVEVFMSTADSIG